MLSNTQKLTDIVRIGSIRSTFKSKFIQNYINKPILTDIVVESE